MSPHVLFAAHLGGGSGHLHAAAAVRDAVSAAGARCSVALPESFAAQRSPAFADTLVLPAPEFRAPRRALPPAACWAEALFPAGLEDPDVVTGLVAAWLGLLDALEPDLVVSEFCPAALLAARIRGVRARAVGSGFTVPPPFTPMPGIQPWRALPSTRFEAAEQRILSAFDAALDCFGAPRLEHLAELYPAAAARLLNFPELDHYGLRDADACIGPLPAQVEAADADYPAGDGPTLLACYRPAYRHFPDLLAWLRRSDHRVLLIAPGLSGEQAAALSSPRLLVSGRQLPLPELLAGADLALLHGGHGVTAAALVSGTPTILVPEFVEQAMLAWRLEARDLALLLAPERGRPLPDLQACADRLAAPAHVAARRAFVARHGAHEPRRALAALGAWLLS